MCIEQNENLHLWENLKNTTMSKNNLCNDTLYVLSEDCRDVHYLNNKKKWSFHDCFVLFFCLKLMSLFLYSILTHIFL